MIVGYLKTTTHLHASSRVNEVIDRRQFCRYLSRRDRAVYIPERSLVPKARSKVRVHIFTPAEIQARLRTAQALKPNRTLVPHTYARLIALLWVTGLRGGEALRLNLEDIDLTEGILHIKKTKFFKSRLVPLSESTVHAIKAYLVVRKKFNCEDPAPAPLFMSLQRKRLAKSTVQSVFKPLTVRAGITPVEGRGPRLHDLRHSFATQTLNDYYQAGKDPSACLAILAPYMGPSDLNYPPVYLPPSMLTLEAAAERFEKHVALAKGPRAGGSL